MVELGLLVTKLGFKMGKFAFKMAKSWCKMAKIVLKKGKFWFKMDMFGPGQSKNAEFGSIMARTGFLMAELGTNRA